MKFLLVGLLTVSALAFTQAHAYGKKDKPTPKKARAECLQQDPDMSKKDLKECIKRKRK